MIKTATGREHALWSQIVNKESDTRRRFEYMTGETTAKKFFQGQNAPNVERNLDTYKQFLNTRRSTTTDPVFANPNGIKGVQASAGVLERLERQSNAGGRYNSSTQKAEQLSCALESVVQDRKSQRARGMSSTVSRTTEVPPREQTDGSRYASANRHLQSSTMNSFAPEATRGEYRMPQRPSIWEKNMKNGVKYADHKTRARKFDLD